METKPFHFRAATADDLNFIYDSWCKSLWPEFQHVNQFRDLQGYRIKKILDYSSALVACDVEDPSIIFGYVVFELDLLHWIYVKYPFRKMGLATDMLKNIPYTALFYHSHRNKAGKHLARKMNSRFNPFVLERYGIFEESNHEAKD